MSDFIYIISFCLTGLITGYILGFFCAKISKRVRELLKKTGFYFHHTLCGIPALAIAVLFLDMSSFFFLGLGIGVIIHDFLIHKSLKFITKIDRE